MSNKNKYWSLFENEENAKDEEYSFLPKKYSSYLSEGYGYTNYTSNREGYYGNLYSNQKNVETVIKQGLSWYAESSVNASNDIYNSINSSFNFEDLSLSNIYNILTKFATNYLKNKNINNSYVWNIYSENQASNLNEFLNQLGITNYNDITNALSNSDSSFLSEHKYLDNIIIKGQLLNSSDPKIAKQFYNGIMNSIIRDLNDAKKAQISKNKDKVKLHTIDSCLYALYYIFCEYNKIISKDDIEMFGKDYYKNFNKENIDFDIKEKNNWWFNILSNTDNYIMKTITQNSTINSNVISNNLTQSVCKSIYSYVSSKLEADPNYNAQDFKNDCGGGSGGGDGEGDPEDSESQGKSGSGSGNMNQQMKDILNQDSQQAFDKAKDEIKDKTSAMNMLGIDPSKATDEEMNDVNNIIKEINNVKLRKEDIEKFVRTSIKNFNSSFRGHKHTTEESFLDADDVDDLRDMHLLIDLSLIDDIAVTAHKFSMKYNLYVDCSGSMSSNVAMNKKTKGQEVSEIKRITLAKILAYKMNKMNILNYVYKFESEVDSKPVTDIIKQLKAGGGTCIDNVVTHIDSNKIPSIILSDGDDYINNYSDCAYLFTISSTCSGEAVVEMIKKGRAVHFEDGNFTKYTIDEYGNPIIDVK
tara:strand:+ start:7029 stop:8954 length:1926 start_codon:yes stop_codon:yes gene_type:complete